MAVTPTKIPLKLQPVVNLPIQLKLPDYIDPQLLTNAILETCDSIKKSTTMSGASFSDTCTQYSLLIETINALNLVTKTDLDLPDTEYMYFKDINSLKNYLVAVKHLINLSSDIRSTGLKPNSPSYSPSYSPYIQEMILRELSSREGILDLMKSFRDESEQALYAKALISMLNALVSKELN